MSSRSPRSTGARRTARGPFVPPGAYTVRLTVNGAVFERPIRVRLDPRVEMTEEDLTLQTDSSLACYRGYLELQDIREAIDARGSAPMLQSLRGRGAPSAPDFLYGSISEAPEANQTVVGLQQKFLFMLALLQAAGARPTSQALEAISKLTERLGSVTARWNGLR